MTDTTTPAPYEPELRHWLGPVGNFTEDDYDPREAARRCDVIAKRARDLAKHYRKGAISKEAAAANMARGRAELAEMMEARR